MTSSGKRIKVTMVDDTVYDLRIMPGDVVRCERQFNISAGDLERDPRLEQILYVAWVSSKRHEYGGTFDEWVDAVSDLDITTGEPDPPSHPVP